MTWKEAFLKQAENDYSVFREFNASRKPISQQLHYLQMATEKLAKALSRGHRNDPPKTTHAALGKFLRLSKSRVHRKPQRDLDYAGNHNAFVSYIDSLLPFADKIEALAPRGGRLDKPNPEYPWQSADGTVIAPLDHTFDDIWLDVANMNKLKTLIANLIRIG
jgi:hypothetical protein